MELTDPASSRVCPGGGGSSWRPAGSDRRGGWGCSSFAASHVHVEPARRDGRVVVEDGHLVGRESDHLVHACPAGSLSRRASATSTASTPGRAATAASTADT